MLAKLLQNLHSINFLLTMRLSSIPLPLMERLKLYASLIRSTGLMVSPRLASAMAWLMSLKP